MSRSPAPSPTCPAAEVTHGTLSLHPYDARCRVSGLLRGTENSPCCGEYTLCPVWKVEKEKVWTLGRHRSNRSDTMINAGSGEWE
jgi:hypothetical protein